MKIGTFRCWLFGHKFVFIQSTFDLNDDSITIHTLKPMNYCVRCGIYKTPSTTGAI